MFIEFFYPTGSSRIEIIYFIFNSIRRVSWSRIGRSRVRRSGVGLDRSSVGRSRIRRSRISRSGVVVLADDHVGQVSVVVGDVVDVMNGSIGHASVPVTDLLARFDVLLTTLLVAVVVVDGVILVDNLGLHINRFKR
jgi:hypothetical protein